MVWFYNDNYNLIILITEFLFGKGRKAIWRDEKVVGSFGDAKKIKACFYR
jgi:hypothetical protein